MNIAQDAATKLVDYPASPTGGSVLSVVQAGKRVINVRAFQEKYNAMLNLVEFMASMNQVGAKNARLDKQMLELKSLFTQARDGLRSFDAGKIMPEKSAGQHKEDSREH